ncbi:ABC transporter C family member 3 [Acorus calamus]|uniref:ABC transporter C family member 3 n=1 Tax=Acorus calamus TaxID=4465 RepID=A0AAV9F123_ACOCL|nr:ABC transporter C family member 3 [Acorus calamus]
MEMLKEIIYASLLALLFAWVITESLKKTTSFSDEPMKQEQFPPQLHKSMAAVLCITISITITYLGFCFYEIWSPQTNPTTDSAFKTASWLLITAFTISCRHKQQWPSVLIFWWSLSFTLTTISITMHFISDPIHIEFLLDYLPPPTFADFVSSPLVLCLFINGLAMNCGTQKVQELKKPLLDAEEAKKGGFAGSGLWGRITFRWLNPVFERGRSGVLEFRDVPPVPEPETSENSFASLRDTLRGQKTNVVSLPKAVIHAIWRPLAINAVFAGINTISSYMGPLLITNFVEFLSGKDSNQSNTYGFVLAFLFLLSKTVESLSQRHWYFGAHRIGIRARAALMVALYKKALSIKYTSASNGKIINFLDVDVERVGDFCWYFHGIWLLPLQVSLALLILYKNLGGAASLSALITTVLVMVSNTPLANMQERLHSKIMEAKDSRIKATSEALKCMRVLKLHSWENTFMERLLKIRESERSFLKRYLYTCSAICFLFWASPTLVSIVTFSVCIIVKTPLTPGTVLSALATFRILQEPIYNLPELMSMIAQTKVSLHRIQDFIKKDDKKKKNMIKFNLNMPHNVAIEIEAGEYSWESNSSRPTIKIDKKMKIMRGQKVAICGPVASGKSSLLCGVLGEIPRTCGAEIKVFGSKAYVTQTAWIQTGTVRENVLFGREMDERFYGEVLKGCALDRDVEIWADGEMTLVGERGINLSGGQKQRIQLARAVYSNSDVYLLDDPFSAVDAHTGAHLFKECLLKLLADKTVIYVTHQLEFLNASDLVLVMKDGKIVQSGKYEDLINDTNGDLVQQMAAHKQSLSQVTSHQHNTPSPMASHQLHQMELIEIKMDDCNRNTEINDKHPEEERELGRVKWSVYSTFVTLAYRGALVPVILLCQVLFQGLQMGSNYWIAYATEEEGRFSKEKLIGVFALLSGGSSAFILVRAFLLTTIALATAQKLHLRMIKSIFRAPILFFDTTPSSRILNRSSTDQSTVDTDIPYRLAGLAFALVQLLGIIILMSQVAWPVFLLFLVVIAISIWYQLYYINTARELARMVSTRKAPILHHFSESIAGAATIRCFNQEERFFTKNLSLIDDYSRVMFHNSATMEWLCTRINFLFNLIFFCLLVILVSLPKGSIDPSLAGLAATYGLNLNVLQAWVIWNLCNVENKMISVERILQFTNLPSEAPLVIESFRPEQEWPTKGMIEMENLHVRYSPSLPLVLKGINCTFPGMKKIGVVGRTGSGKSTLIQALFRVVEPSEGRILIDGLDICQMGLHDLRSRLSIIPQDPTLFQGSVRTNLDPLQQHQDVDIWEALRKCRLGEVIRKDQRLLDAPVSEDGVNWSVGQRQLVCLVRVLLKKRRILVLDEATASVDTATDNVIQKTIREETDDCTVITVAHRIPTVIDNDLVLVLDEGKVLEYDSPAVLLKDKSSAFSKLVSEFLGRSNDNQDLPK